MNTRLVLGLFPLCLSACSGQLPSFPTPTPTSTATVTPTVIWFPATATPSPLPTPTSPAWALLPYGDLILKEDFTHPDFWSLVSLPAAGARLDQNRMILSVSEGAFYLLTWRNEPVFRDFYLRVGIRLHLCRGKDAYGIIFRLRGEGDYYRYILTCQGQSRLERVRGGKVIPLQEWLTSGDVPAGAPGEVGVGLWVGGNEMRVFLNERYQFAVRDSLFRSGRIGFFALSVNETALLVSFSDLAVYALDSGFVTSAGTPPTP